MLNFLRFQIKIDLTNPTLTDFESKPSTSKNVHHSKNGNQCDSDKEENKDMPFGKTYSESEDEGKIPTVRYDHLLCVPTIKNLQSSETVAKLK